MNDKTKECQLTMTNSRDRNLKIPDIKAVRSLTRLLGKIGIKDLYRDNPTYWEGIRLGYPPHPMYPPKVYGLGLKEAKDYIEAKYNYKERLPKRNIIQDVKCARRFMGFLEGRLGIKAAVHITGLYNCKQYVTSFIPPERY